MYTHIGGLYLAMVDGRTDKHLGFIHVLSISTILLSTQIPCGFSSAKMRRQAWPESVAVAGFFEMNARERVHFET